MLSRTYTVLMPSDAGTYPTVDIPVENFNPTAAVAPVVVGVDGFYSEWRNLPIRVPVKAGAAATPAAGFVPRFRLGYSLAVSQVGGIGAANLLAVRLSRSLVGNVISNAAGTTTPGDGTFQDPSGAPTIRLLNTAAVQGLTFRVSLLVPTQIEDARNGVG